MLYIFYKIYDIEKFDDKGTRILPPFLIRNLDQGKSEPQVHFPCATPGALTLTPSITHHAPYSPPPTPLRLSLTSKTCSHCGARKQSNLHRASRNFLKIILDFILFSYHSWHLNCLPRSQTVNLRLESLSVFDLVLLLRIINYFCNAVPGKTETLIPISMPDMQIQVCGQNESCCRALTTVINGAGWVASTIWNTFLVVLETGSSKLKCQHDEFLQWALSCLTVLTWLKKKKSGEGERTEKIWERSSLLKRSSVLWDFEIRGLLESRSPKTLEIKSFIYEHDAKFSPQHFSC